MNLCDLNPFLRFASKMLYDVSYNAMPVLVSDCRLFYILEGSGQLEIGDARHNLEPGCLFYCCAGSRYTIRCGDFLRLFSLNFGISIFIFIFFTTVCVLIERTCKLSTQF